MISNFDIYLICNIDNIKSLLTILGLVLLIIGNFLIISYMVIAEDDGIDINKKQLKRLLIINNSIALICLIASVLIPNRESLIYMQVNNVITKENLNFATNQIKEIIDYIVLKTKEIADVIN